MRVWLPLLCILIVGCSTDPYPYELEQFEVPNGGYKCVVIGDWGRKGNVNLKANAYMMNELSCRLTLDAVLTTGDNFYESGVENTSDALWKLAFEKVFNGDCLLPIPWYPSIGNHDAGGKVLAQVNYSQLSSRWNLAASYWDRWIFTQDSVSIHFVVVDTSPFVEAYYSESSGSGLGYHVTNSDTAKQLFWLDSVLASGNPDWTVVYGHHPVYAAEGRHGETLELIEKFVPIFDAHGVDVYFCGHNHSLELIKTVAPTLYVTSGGGSEPQERIVNKGYNIFGVAEAGFVLSSFAKDSLQLDFISKRGERLFSHVNPRVP